jgi:hypothetical protein
MQNIFDHLNQLCFYKWLLNKGPTVAAREGLLFWLTTTGMQQGIASISVGSSVALVPPYQAIQGQRH